MLKKLAANDIAVKAIFDHFRNIGIISVMFAAAYWSFSITATASGWLLYTSLISTVSLTILGIFLFILNELHGKKKLCESGISKWWELAVRLIYGMSVFMIISSLLSRTK